MGMSKQKEMIGLLAELETIVGEMQLINEAQQEYIKQLISEKNKIFDDKNFWHRQCLQSEKELVEALKELQQERNKTWWQKLWE